MKDINYFLTDYFLPANDWTPLEMLPSVSRKENSYLIFPQMESRADTKKCLEVKIKKKNSKGVSSTVILVLP